MSDENTLIITIKNVSELIPYVNNARTHSQEQIEKIAESIKNYGMNNPILIDKHGVIIAGHGRFEALKFLGIKEIPTITLEHLSDEKNRRAYTLADNRIALDAGWDTALLSKEFEELQSLDFDLLKTGFTQEEINELLNPDVIEGQTDAEEIPEPAQEVISVYGDVWMLGNHRLMCGDSTIVTDVEKLMRDEKSTLLHADPPYGMGKVKDGVQNDNLYDENLDKFQMDWWNTYRSYLVNNASAYIWGNAPELWQLWYAGGLSDSERFTFHNEIVWDKENTPGMKSAEMRSYPISTERCLFFALGEQGYNNNTDNFWEGFEPIRAYLDTERKKMGWTNKEIGDWFGVSDRMLGHWFSKSQWTMPTKEQYKVFQEKAEGKAFLMPYESAGADLEDKKNNLQSVKGEFYKTRTYFNNAHDIMTDVWRFPHVIGEERHGHATPKPVIMMERILNSSSKKGDIVIEPFGGSGATLMGCEKTGRQCRCMELSPKYIDVIIRRWQSFTGKHAVLEGNEKTFNEISGERRS